MNARLRHQRSFLAAQWSSSDEDYDLLINSYQLNLSFLTHSEDNHEINVAIQRVLYLIDQEFNHTVFVDQQNQEMVQALEFMGANVTTMPGEPGDQLIGIMLWCKFTAVMQDRVELIELEISSDLGQHVTYLHDHTESLGPFDQTGWWHDHSPWHSDLSIQPSDLAQIKPDPWHELDLAWTQESVKHSSIVYADFGKNAN